MFLYFKKWGFLQGPSVQIRSSEQTISLAARKAGFQTTNALIGPSNMRE